jgi:MFS family permease
MSTAILTSSSNDATWSLTSYLIANGIVLTISGWLSTVFGRKRYFLICITMFTVASLLCGMSRNLTELIVCRLVQGFFGGGLQPTQQAIVLDSFDPSRRTLAFGITAVATVVAPVIGPTLGGIITDNYSWPWIFFINVPIGALTFFAVCRLVEDPPWARRRPFTGIDYIGIGLIALGLGSLQVMMDRGEDEGWLGSPFIRVFASLAAIGIAGAIAWLLYARKPVINIRLFKDSNFATSSFLMATMAMILYASVHGTQRLRLDRRIARDRRSGRAHAGAHGASGAPSDPARPGLCGDPPAVSAGRDGAHRAARRECRADRNRFDLPGPARPGDDSRLYRHFCRVRHRGVLCGAARAAARTPHRGRTGDALNDDYCACALACNCSPTAL